MLHSAVERPTSWLPAHELLAAVLLQALEDLCATDLAGAIERDEKPATCKRRLRRAARQWFRSERKTAGSFLWCCSLLGLDPEAVRRASYNADHTRPKKIGPRVHHLQNKLASENSLDRPRLWA